MLVFVLPMAATGDESSSVTVVSPQPSEELMNTARAQLERAAQGERTGCITLRYSAALLLAQENQE